MIPRKLGRSDLKINQHDADEATQLLTGWHPELWSVDTAARALIITDIASNRQNSFSAQYTDVCRTADLNEQIALYQTTALLQPNDALDQALSEGLRTSI